MGAIGRRLVVVLAVLAAALAVSARPLIRNVKSDREFKALIKHHKEVTGLPVIVDFFSHSCGPCRMIAPVFKRIAKQYKNRAVFAKVDVNSNYATSQRLRIRSMPTFHFYMNGKLRHQFSGADQRSLEQFTRNLSREAERNDVRLTKESLRAFYDEHDAKKSDADIDKLLKKAGNPNGGPGHAKLRKALKSKYGVAPKSARRVVPEKRSKKKVANLKDVSSAAIFAELERRGEYVPFSGNAADSSSKNEGGDVDDDVEEEEEEFAVWQPQEGRPERVLIVGAGPAGLSAAVYAARAGLRPLVVAPPMGGQLQGKGVNVENYPGILDDTGPGIVAKMTNQAIKSGASFLQEEVIDVDLSERPFTVVTNTTRVKTYALILATGANSRWLGVPGEHTYRGGGVSTCATCDGFLFRDRDVVVVGGGDTAMEDALVLARTSTSVTVIHRRDDFRASRVLSQRVLEHNKINVLWNSTVIAFEGETVRVESEEDSGDAMIQDSLTHVVVRNSNTGDETKLPVAAAFVAIGHDPNTGIVIDHLDADERGYLRTKHPTTATSIEGVFAAGDVADHIYRQAVTSAGTGARAALDAERWLSESGVTNAISHNIADDASSLEDDDTVDAKSAGPRDDTTRRRSSKPTAPPMNPHSGL